MENARAAKIVENPKMATQVTHANAAKFVAYWKASAQVVATPVKKPPVSAPVLIANKPTAYAAKMAKNTPAQVDNMTSKMKKNMMPPVKNVNVKRVNIPA